MAGLKHNGWCSVLCWSQRWLAGGEIWPNVGNVMIGAQGTAAIINTIAAPPAP